MKIITGNLLSNETGILIHGVNCQKVMGSGIALQIKNQYPEVYDSYLEYFIENPSPLGEIDIVIIKPDLMIVNAFTQMYYGKNPNTRYVSYDAIDNCFKAIANFYESEELKHKNIPIRFPLIGAGKGNGNWHCIHEIILSNLEHIVESELIELWLPKEFQS